MFDFTPLDRAEQSLGNDLHCFRVFVGKLVKEIADGTRAEGRRGARGSNVVDRGDRHVWGIVSGHSSIVKGAGYVSTEAGVFPTVGLW